MSLFDLFRRKRKQPEFHYKPEFTADCKGILSAPLLPDRTEKLTPEEVDRYIAEIGMDRRN